MTEQEALDEMCNLWTDISGHCTDMDTLYSEERKEAYQMACNALEEQIKPVSTMKREENKRVIVQKLKELLWVTRAGSRISDLVLNEQQDEVVIVYESGGSKKVNICADSGLAIIRDVAKGI